MFIVYIYISLFHILYHIWHHTFVLFLIFLFWGKILPRCETPYVIHYHIASLLFLIDHDARSAVNVAIGKPEARHGHVRMAPIHHLLRHEQQPLAPSRTTTFGSRLRNILINGSNTIFLDIFHYLLYIYNNLLFFICSLCIYIHVYFYHYFIFYTIFDIIRFSCF